MNRIDAQKEYWDSVATARTFTHPIPMKELSVLLPVSGKILDYGCGYGRTCAELAEGGFVDVVGVDISTEMISRGTTLNPDLDLRHFDGRLLPFRDATFDACTLLAVLTCIPTDAGQKHVISEIHRVLRPGGLLYVSDYPIQQDTRNQDRYREFENEFGKFGIFRLSNGGIVRHHDMSWIHKLLSEFELLKEGSDEVSTMLGNVAYIFQILARKR